jgi:ferrous iron transport protein B
MSTASVETKRMTIAVAGNPNTGKTTLFNGLTGGKQRIGNWPGVTVEKKTGVLRSEGQEVTVVDLPGIYSLSAASEDEVVARDYLLSGEPDLVVNIVDACNLERNLYLTTNLLEMGVPVLVVLNMIDLARKDKVEIDLELLRQELGVPVVAITATERDDIRRVVRNILEEIDSPKSSSVRVAYPNEIERVISEWSGRVDDIARRVGTDERWVVVKLLEGDQWITEKAVNSGCLAEDEIRRSVGGLKEILKDEPDVVLAEYRYGFIQGVTSSVIRRSDRRISTSEQIDRIVMSKILGIPIFLGVMYLVFWVTMNVGGAFIDFFDILFGGVFVDGFGALLGALAAPEWLVTILADGIGAGLQTVSTFIPIIFMMFLMLSLLEDSGYMARAAYVMDRFMRFLGLPGKAFIPLLVGFGCTIPAVMATRTLENKKDRYLTIFMAPCMSCGARLPVYALFAAAFFPKNAGWIVFSIYMAGIGVALVTGLLLKNTLFRGETSHFVMELPPYHAPRMRHIMAHTWNRLKIFILRAGKVIVLVVAVLSFMNSFGVDGTFGNEDTDTSVLTRIGKTITPIFEPMGIERENWPATVAIFTGLFAKEAVVGTLSGLYSQIGGVEEGGESFSLLAAVAEAAATVPENLSGIFGDFGDPLGYGVVTGDEAATSDALETDSSIYGVMRKHFSAGSMQAYAYLLFILIYFPCVAALGVIIREIGKGYGWMVVLYLTLMGWIIATLFYQITTAHQVVWIIVPMLLLGVIYTGFRVLASRA